MSALLRASFVVSAVVSASALAVSGGCERERYCPDGGLGCPVEHLGLGLSTVARREVGVIDEAFDRRLVAAIESSSVHATRTLAVACRGLASDLGVTPAEADVARDGASMARAWCPAAFDGLAALRSNAAVVLAIDLRRCGQPLSARTACEAECGGDPACLDLEAASRCSDAYDVEGERSCSGDAAPTSCPLADERCVEGCVAAARIAAICEAHTSVAADTERAVARRVRLLGDVVAAMDRLRAVSAAPRAAIAPGIAERAGECRASTLRRLEIAERERRTRRGARSSARGRAGRGLKPRRAV